MNNVGKGVIAGAVVGTTIIFIGMCLFIAGFLVVEPNYMAIARNKMSSKIQDDKVYFEGRHYLGVGNEFITYPLAWQLVEFTDDDSVGETPFVCKVDVPLDASANGLSCQVEVSIYFTIPPQQLINFYTNQGINYESIIASECKETLKNTIGSFNNEEVITARLKISEAMTANLKRRLAVRLCKLEKVLLRGISFDKSMEDTIETTVMADQRKTANEYNNQIAMIHAEIDGLKKEYDYKINLIIAEAQKNATLLIEEAKAYANSVYANSTAAAWSAYQSVTNLDNENLLRVQWARSLGATTAKDSIALGYDTIGSKFVQKVSNA